MELWKSIPGYEGLYEINNHGDIRNIKRGKLLGFGINNRGYYLTTLWKNNKQRTFSVHRLVAQLFVDNPDNKKQVNHKDSCKINNMADNLEWVTCQQNILHSVEKGTFKASCRKSV